jgi:hypothetical protein
MKKIEPKPGETAAEYLKRCLQEAHEKTPITEPVIASITYQINGIDTDPAYLRLTPIDFKSRKISITFDAVPLDPEFVRYTWNSAHIVKDEPEYRMDTITGEAMTPEEYIKQFMYSDCRRKKMDVKLKRYLR